MELSRPDLYLEVFSLFVDCEFEQPHHLISPSFIKLYLKPILNSVIPVK